MIYNTISRIPTILSVIILTLCLAPQKANAVHWTVTGPGITDIMVKSHKVIFSYNLDVRRASGEVSWTLTGHNFVPDTHIFNWKYHGSHDKAQTATTLTAPDYTLVAAGSGNGIFDYRGGLSIRNDRKDDFVFRMSAVNDDAAHYLTGTLEVSMVPVPAAFLPFAVALGFIGIAAGRRRSVLRDNA